MSDSSFSSSVVLGSTSSTQTGEFCRPQCDLNRAIQFTAWLLLSKPPITNREPSDKTAMTRGARL